MKKSASKIIASALLAPAVMLVILFITGIVEIAFQGDMIAWFFEIFICICTVPMLLVFEYKKKSGELALACNAAYFISAVVMAVPVYMAVMLYLEYGYDVLNPWSKGQFLSGIQWLLYLFTVYAQVVLHLVIRIIIAVVRRIRAERKIADKEKYGDEE